MPRLGARPIVESNLRNTSLAPLIIGKKHCPELRQAQSNTMISHRAQRRAVRSLFLVSNVFDRDLGTSHRPARLR